MNIADLLRRDPTPAELSELSAAKEAVKASTTSEVQILLDRLAMVAKALGYPKGDARPLATKTAPLERSVWDN